VALLHGKPARIETLGGEIASAPASGGIAIDMGVPRFEWQEIPLAYAMDTHSLPIAWDTLESPTAVNVGNPHVVFFVADCEDAELDRLGPEIEHDPLFPERINVNVATVQNRELIRLRVWERGVGETLACGTGACATAIGAMRRGLAERAVTVRLTGGDLRIEWTAQGRIRMTGPATESFRGSFESADFGC
jgi:diaminopimelate epimerase